MNKEYFVEHLGNRSESEVNGHCGDPDQIVRCLRAVTDNMQGRSRDSISLADRLNIDGFETGRAALNVLMLKCRDCAARGVLNVNETLSFTYEDSAAGTTGVNST